MGIESSARLVSLRTPTPELHLKVGMGVRTWSSYNADAAVL